MAKRSADLVWREGDLKEGDDGWSWANSKSRQQLMRDCTTGKVPLTSEEFPPQDAFYSRRLFYKECEYKNWANRLRAIRNKILHDSALGEECMEGLHHDRKLYPMTTHDTVGRPHWQGSEAEEKLKAYVAGSFDMVESVIDGSFIPVHNPNRLAKARDLYDACSNEAYRRFTYNVFKKKIYQEGKTQKYYNHRNKKKGFVTGGSDSEDSQW